MPKQHHRASRAEDREVRRKLRRIVKGDGRTVLVAFDHAIVGGPLPGSENVEMVLGKIAAGRPDGIMVNPGVAKRFGAFIHKRGISLVVSIPLSPRFVKYASGLGADAVKTTYFGDVFDRLAVLKHEDVSATCDEYSIPYLAEIVPALIEQNQTKILDDPWLVSTAARKAAEVGADIVKTTFTGDTATFRQVVSTTFIPVVILGGEKFSDDESAIDLARSAMQAGCAGIAFGRNIWKNENPSRIIRALRDVIHSNKEC